MAGRAVSFEEKNSCFLGNSTAKRSIKQTCDELFNINEGYTTISPEMLKTKSEEIEGTIILPSLEELREQEFFEDPVQVERALYGDDLFLEFFDNPNFTVQIITE